MHVDNTAKRDRPFQEHPTQTVVRHARGKQISDLPSLENHLAGCSDCRDLMLFVQKITNISRPSPDGKRRLSIDDELKTIGLTKQHAVRIFRSRSISHR